MTLRYWHLKGGGGSSVEPQGPEAPTLRGVESISNTSRGEVPLPVLGWDFDMFPNPARGTVFLRTTDVLIKKVMLLDVAGRTVFVEDNVSSPAYNIPIDNLALGAYWVRVTDGSNTKVKRLIVQ